jgi:hypothetical protein
MGRTVSSFSINSEILRQLKEILAREKQSLSAWIEGHAVHHIKAHGAGNPSVPLDKFLADPSYRACPTLLEASKFNVRTIRTEDIAGWRTETHKFLQRLLEEEGRRKAGGQPE